MTHLSLSYRSLGVLAIVTLLLLMIPLIAMQMTNEVRWGPGDFAIAALLLFGTGLTYLAVVRRARVTSYRFATGLGVAGLLAVIWVNLAVGLVGATGDPVNLLFAAVPIVAITGAIRSGFAAAGLARTMNVTAITFGAVTLIALTTHWLQAGQLPGRELMLLGGMMLPFVFSAQLFRRAAHRHVDVVRHEDS